MYVWLYVCTHIYMYIRAALLIFSMPRKLVPSQRGDVCRRCFTSYKRKRTHTSLCQNQLKRPDTHTHTYTAIVPHVASNKETMRALLPLYRADLGAMDAYVKQQLGLQCMYGRLST